MRARDREYTVSVFASAVDNDNDDFPLAPLLYFSGFFFLLVCGRASEWCIGTIDAVPHIELHAPFTYTIHNYWFSIYHACITSVFVLFSSFICRFCTFYYLDGAFESISTNAMCLIYYYYYYCLFHWKCEQRKKRVKRNEMNCRYNGTKCVIRHFVRYRPHFFLHSLHCCLISWLSDRLSVIPQDLILQANSYSSSSCRKCSHRPEWNSMLAKKCWNTKKGRKPRKVPKGKLIRHSIESIQLIFNFHECKSCKDSAFVNSLQGWA